jgi:hypothetical protein
MKDKDAYNELIEEVLSMIAEYTPDYSTLLYNPTKKLISKNFKKISESNYNKNLSDIINFPLKSAEEFFVMTNCIINQKLIKIPARTSKCQHIECLEVRNLFLYILEFKKCPLCKELEESGVTLEKDITVGLDEIYIDKNFKEIFRIAKNEHEEMGFPFSLIIFNKFKSMWRAFIPNRSYYESEILLETCSDKIYNLQKLDEGNKNYMEIVEMNKFIGKDSELNKVLKQIVIGKGI